MWLICVGPLLRGTLAEVAANGLPRENVFHERREVAPRPAFDEQPHTSACIVSIMRVNSTGVTHVVDRELPHVHQGRRESLRGGAAVQPACAGCRTESARTVRGTALM